MRFLSLVIPVYHPPRRFLEELINSIASQIRSDVEVILSVDGPLRAQDEWVRPLGQRHHWITVLEGAVDDRHGISATTNRGVVVASGDYVAFVDQDDLLIDGCLDTYCEFLRNDPSIDIAYCDEQTIDENGAVQTVFRKPDWNPTRLECQNYICHMLTVRRTVFHNLGNYRSEFDYAQDWDLCLRAMDAGARFDHIRKVLYGWRAHGSSTASSINNKSEVHSIQRAALEEHVRRAYDNARVIDAEPSDYFWISRQSQTPVSIIIPTRASQVQTPGVAVSWSPSLVEGCVESIHSSLKGCNYEIVVVVDRETDTPGAADLLATMGCRVVFFDSLFNFSKKCNLGAEVAKHDLLVFLNDDILCRTPRWTAEMAAVAEDSSIGAVGARLLFPSGMTQHAGHVFVGAGVTHACYGQEELTYNARDLVDSEVVGVTAACLMIRRDVFEAVGGFCEDFPSAFNDVDICQKVRVRGHRCVTLGRVSHLHLESQTRDPSTGAEEVRMLYTRWGSILMDDPFRSSGDGFAMDFDRREAVSTRYASEALARVRSALGWPEPNATVHPG